jgi:uncharacterized protein YbjT (DUF2867 family)
MKKKILITLATGKTGYATALELLQEGYQIRILVRSRNEKALSLEKLGAEIAIGEFNNYEQLKDALEGIDTVYYCYPYKPGMHLDVPIFIKVAQEANIKSVVLMGIRFAEYVDTGSPFISSMRISYDLFERSGLNVVYFIPGYFADNVFPVTEFILQLGIWPSPYKNGKNPYISNEDMARCIVALLKNPEPYYGQRLFPTGPESISTSEITKIFSKVSGRAIRFIHLPEWVFVKSGILVGPEYGFDAYLIMEATLANKHMERNRFHIEPTSVVRELTGQDPEDFETITRRYFGQSKYNKPSISGWFSAAIKLLKTPFIKVPKVENF